MENIKSLLESTFELANDCIYLMNSNGKIFYANETVCKFLEYSKEEITKLNLWDIDNTFNTQEKFSEIYRKAKKSKKNKILIESEHKKSNGRKIPIEMSFLILYINEKEYLVSYVKDISYKLRQDEEIKLYFEFINELNEMVFLVDVKTELIKFANEKVYKKLDYTKKELAKIKISEIRKPLVNNSDEIAEVFSKIKDKKIMTTFGKYLTKNGDYIPVETSLIMKNYQNKDYVMAISRDITDRLEIKKERDEINRKLENYNKTLESEIQRVETELIEYQTLLHRQAKMASIGEMLENIAHQWRQPLSVISVIATGLNMLSQDEGIDIKKLEEGLKSINENTQYLSKTIDDFRNFFKPNNKKSSFLVSEAIEYTLSIIKVKFKPKNVVIKKTIDDFELYSFKNELCQVFINILNNAMDELEKQNLNEKLIFIETKKNDDFLFISITDNAKGIDKNIIDRIFEPYFTTKGKSKGSGIGLYMCEEIVQKHMDGLILVKNKEYEYNNSKYKGAKFTIKLPINKTT